jgi:hypothetical protein
MWLLRIATRNRWAADRKADDPGHVDGALDDIELRAGEPGLSVFRVEGEDESREAAVRYVLNCRDDRNPVDYLVFHAELAERLGLTVIPAPRQDLHPWLSERHYEILGLTDELTRSLAVAILSDSRRRVQRIPKADLPVLGEEICRRDPAIRPHLSEKWAARLLPRLANPDPEA